jgi:hypothetical protein
MKIKIEEIMGDQKIFLIQKFAVWVWPKINFSNSVAMPKIVFFCCLNAHVEGKCVIRSSDEKHSKLNAESNSTGFV